VWTALGMVRKSGRRVNLAWNAVPGSCRDAPLAMRPPSRPFAVRRPVSTATAPGRFRRAAQTLLPAQAERPVSILILPAATLFPWSSPPCAREPVLPGAGRAGHIPQTGRARGCRGASLAGRMLPRLPAGCGIQVPRRLRTTCVLIGPYGFPSSLPLNSNFRNERPGGSRVCRRPLAPRSIAGAAG